MRILHLYKDYYPVLGGIENHIRVLAEAQAEAGHTVSVLACNPGRRTRIEVLNDVNVIKAGRLATLASMPLSLRQPWHLLSSSPDLIHVQSPYPLGEVSASLLKSSTPLVISYQSDIVRQRGWLRLYAPMLRAVLRHAAKILVSSPRYLATSPWLEAVRDKCIVVPLGVDVERYTPPPHPYQGPPTLLFVGRLRYYKGLDTLLQAMVSLPGEVHLRIVGRGEMLDVLQEMTAALALSDRVHFVGEVSDADLPAEYRQASAFVLPANARAEAFGMVLLEAMASGLPCVTTEVGTGTSWVVHHGVTGLVVPPQSPEALAAALRELLADPQRLYEMGQAARARVVAEFAQERLVDRVMEVYQSLV